jgi:NADH-quinone oxidoreductase subunit J
VDLETALTKPGDFGRYLFQRHWLSIEIVSLLLLVALIAALYLGKRKGKEANGDKP